MASVIENMRRHSIIGQLIVINVAVFVLAAISMLLAKAGIDIRIDEWLTLPSSWREWLIEPWTLVTYMFTHTHPLHLLMNVLWLGWFGSILLSSAVSGRVIIWLYIGGGLSGGVLYMLLAPMLGIRASVLMGASASVLAIMTYAAVILPQYTFHLFFLGDVKLKWMALFMILLAFLGLGGGNAGGELAHIGGAAFGLTAALFKKNTTREKAKIFSHTPNPRRSSRVISIMEQHRQDARRLDELLDKIRISGFGSLSKSERKELEDLSKRVTK